MIRFNTFLLIMLILLLCSCNSAAPEINPTPGSTTVEEPSPSNLPTTAPTVGSPPTAEMEVTPTIPNSPTPEPSTIPAPTLFDLAWGDRDQIIAGLVDSSEGNLNELINASEYHLALQIDDPTTVIGQMELHYTNQESVPLEDIYFHLFANHLGGNIDVQNITINNQPVNAVNESTYLRVPLLSPLQPGEDVVISLDFTTTVPIEESTKYNILAFNNDILALAHFYPMVAVFDDEGWNIEPSPAHGDETYADMSFYLVEITAPDNQVIAASGSEVKSESANGSQFKTIAAGPVRDFYLVMSDRFSVVTRDVGPTRVNSYAPEEYIDGAQLALDVTSQALQSFSHRFGPYPYTELDIVSTPTLALGIEYPGIFANALRIYDLQDTTSGAPNAIYMESTSAHEAAHQWFYNLVGNDQLDEPWLDEALTQYATWTYFIDRYGEENAQGFYDSLEGRWARIDFEEIPIGLPAEAYSGGEYGAIIYGRGPIFLNVLAETTGQESFDQFMRDYARQFRWKIATTEEFQALAEQHCGCDLTELFNQWVYDQ